MSFLPFCSLLYGHYCHNIYDIPTMKKVASNAACDRIGVTRLGLEPKTPTLKV